MLEPVQVASWIDFWRSFEANLSDGLNRLKVPLRTARLALPDEAVRCSVLSEMTAVATGEEEAEGWLGGGERAVKVRVDADGVFEWTLGAIPVLTSRGTFVHHGQEKALLGQLARSPGVFFQADGEAARSVLVRPEVGAGFRIEHGKRACGIVLQRSGRVCSVDEFAKFLNGDDHAIDADSLQQLAQAVGAGGSALSAGDDEAVAVLAGRVRQRLSSWDLGAIGAAQLDRRLKRFGEPPCQGGRLSAQLLTIMEGLLQQFAARKTEPSDDVWDLGNLRVRLIGDFLENALTEWLMLLQRRVERSVHRGSFTTFANALRSENRNQGGDTLFADCIRRNTVGQRICQSVNADSSNYLQLAALTRRMTFNGAIDVAGGPEGRRARDFHWSHIGRLCPFDTSMGVDVGVTLSLTSGARVNRLGQIEARCWRVADGADGRASVTADEEWISPWEEDATGSGWIALPDERAALERGDEVWAHCGQAALRRVAAAEVSHIHASEDEMLGMAALLVPYRQHNEASRTTMSCNFLRQALPLRDGRPPRIGTGAESSLPSALTFHTESERADGLAFGADLLIGYAIWKGWNYEDAIAISDSAADALTSTHLWHLPPIPLSRPLAGQRAAFAALTDGAESDYSRFDDDGAIRRGERVKIGQPMLIEALPNWKGRGEPTIVEYVVPEPDSQWQRLAMSDELVVHRTIVGNDYSGLGRARVVLRDQRRARAGDKLANRHGHKGVISRIFPDHEMPYFLLQAGGTSSCPCGEPRAHVHLQVLINPLSVLSRMNLGQLLETVAARDEIFKDLSQKVACFDPLAVGERQLEGDILAGVQYVMKLDHNAADKINARDNSVRYSTFVQQPLRGRRHEGGQRLGEMEVWALQAHGVPNLLQELLTLKSDNPRARRELAADLAAGTNEARAELPEALRTLAALCYGLGLDLLLKDPAGGRLDPMLDLVSPEAANEVVIGLLDQDYFLKRVSKGEVESPRSGGGDQIPKVQYHHAGLESESIFGPIADYTCACRAHKLDTAKGDSKGMPRTCPKCKTPLISSGSRRRRMGHIRLPRAVPNPFLLLSTPLRLVSEAADPLWVTFGEAVDQSPSVSATISGLFGSRLRVSFSTKGLGGPASAGAEVRKAATQFLTLAAHASERVRAVLAKRVNAAVRLPVRGAELGTLGAALVGFEVRAKPGDDRSLPLHEAIDACLPSVSHVKSPRKEYGQVVNDILAAAADVPVDFACALIELSTLRAALLSVVPVIPPKLRQKTDFGPNDLTVHYQSLLRTNAELAASDETSETYRSLRRAHYIDVARLMANQLLPSQLQSHDRGFRRLESLSSHIAGKAGLVAGHLLGKRVDFSGRAVIVPDPNLSMDQCRLPFALAVKLFRPLLKSKLRARLRADDLKSVLEDRLELPGALEPESRALLSPLLEELFVDHPVLINRQPTLHRLGLLAFRPILGDGDVIALPALVLKGYNADFDGDQVAVHLPLLQSAREEALRLLPSNHLWHPRSGSYALSQGQDLALGRWRRTGKATGEIASSIEARVGDTSLLESIEEERALAFDAATRSGVSFSPEDLHSIAVQLRGRSLAETVGVLAGLGSDNPIFQIIRSGARGDATTLGYIAGTRFESRQGSNLIEGLMLGERLELVASEARPNLVATKLATGEGGYLTKRMVDWAQYVQVVDADCETTLGITVGGQNTSSLGEVNPTQHLERELVLRWLYGRTLARTVDGAAAGSVLGRDQAEHLAEWLSSDPERTVTVRSPLMCKLDRGVCRACYGAAPWFGRGHRQLDHSSLAANGTCAGLIAAQSVGETFTQTALHRKHSIGAEIEIGAMIQGLVSVFAAAADDCRRIRTRLGQNHALTDAEVTGLRHKLTHIDALVLGPRIEVAIIHLEVLIRGLAMREDRVGWIGDLAAPTGTLELRLARAAIRAASDRLRDPRARLVVGGRLAGIGAK